MSENENLSKLLDVKECELLKKVQAVAEIEKKLSVSAARVLAEKNQLQDDLQRCLQEMHQKELHFQQINSKVT